MFTFENTASGSLNIKFFFLMIYLRHCTSERIKSVLKSTLIIKVPAELFVERLNWRLQLDSGLPHDGVDLLCFLESLVRSVDSVGLQRFLR
jgi:hypothetical protein